MKLVKLDCIVRVLRAKDAGTSEEVVAALTSA